MTPSADRMPPDGADDTVVLPPARRGPPQPRWRAWPWLLVILALAAGAAGGALLLWPGPPRPSPRVETQASPTLVIATASEAELLANRASALVIRRFAGNADVVVLDFPTLGEQARMLNRIAALIEKAGLPRDRLLDDAELEAAARAAGVTAETFYYGHNYRAADLARFFALAEGTGLNPEEERLRALLREIGWLRPGAVGALISLPQEGVEPWLDSRARAAMLRHELSHGEFFANPVHAALVWRFWREMLTEAERTRFRGVLAGASYDPAIEEVMANEAQAFLFHTPDDRFFSPAALGLSPDRVAALRTAFVAGLPEGWLRDAMTR